jgi:SAM domain (Sterile alpha motif)
LSVIYRCGRIKPDNLGRCRIQQVADWLEKLGLGQYAQRFAENDISFAVLSDLTDHHIESALRRSATEVTVMFSDWSARQHSRREWTPRTCGISGPDVRAAPSQKRNPARRA